CLLKDGQEQAKKQSRLIARAPLHLFWEFLNVTIVIAGVALLLLMTYQSPEQPTKIEIVHPST
ncbi:MAG TPA: hypothetical protein VMI30_13360, partial [Stellaceae bacterium]|nr:hypothetical protein [Stellaceae bacterium]